MDVRGGVPGARVRDVGEALAYYDLDAKPLTDWPSPVEDRQTDTGEAKCPFGFVGGANPHTKDTDGNRTNEVDRAEGVDAAKERRMLPPQSEAHISSAKQHLYQEGGERCPWPFIFFHNPSVGMRDWQTWFVFGLLLCWCWSYLH